MKMCFLMPTATNADTWKTVKCYRREGVDVSVLAFERTSYRGGKETSSYVRLGAVKHGAYVRRLIPLLSAVSRARRGLRDADVVYVVGLDMLFLAVLCLWPARGKRKLILEMMDIVPAAVGASFAARCLRFIERRLLGSVDLLVVTAEGFATEYYGKIQGIRGLSYMMLENKVDEQVSPQPVEHEADNLSTSPIRIGYFGLLRCTRSWEILTQIVKQSGGRFSLYVRGFPEAGVERLLPKDVENVPGIEYGGEYVSPRDLAEIYSHVDMVWASFPYEGLEVGGWQWARTNRFYESCYYGKPMLVQKGTADARVVTEAGLGLPVDLASPDEAVAAALAVTRDDLSAWREGLRRFPRANYVYSDDHARVLDIIRGVPGLDASASHGLRTL